MSKGKDWSDLTFEEEKESKEWILLDSDLKQIEQRLSVLWSSKVECVFEIGLELVKYKEIVKREFKQYVIDRLPFSYSTATAYKNVAQAFASPEEAALFDSKTMYALASSQFPAELRADFIARAKKGEKFCVDEVRSARESHAEEHGGGKKKKVVEDRDIYAPTPLPSEIVAVYRVERALEEVVQQVQIFPWPENPDDWLLCRMDMVNGLLRQIRLAFWPGPKKSDSRTLVEAE